MKTLSFNKYTKKNFLLFLIIHLSLYITGCNPLLSRFLEKAFEETGEIEKVENKIKKPIFEDVELSILWIGHSSFLIQIGDKVFLTDPIFTNSIGMILKRKVEAGLCPSAIDRLDYVLISHPHFDHLSYGSLKNIPKAAKILLPKGGLRYMPNLGFSDYKEILPWTSLNIGGVKITAVPVKHFNGRYGFDNGWLKYDTYTGYVIEYQNKKIFFAGDTGYDAEIFKELGEKFRIDIALIPIAPIEPRDFMKRVHTDPQEALQIFYDTQATIMIPTHHRTFIQGLDSTLTYAEDKLRKLSAENGVEDRVLILKIGEQRIINLEKYKDIITGR